MFHRALFQDPACAYRPVPKLSVSDLQRMVSSPAIIWMKRYLGVEAPEDAANPWAATTGKWVHDWLANIIEEGDGKIFSAFPSLIKIDKRIRLAANERRAALQRLCDLLGKVVPDWWNSGWFSRGTSAPKSDVRKGGNGWRRSCPSVAKVP